MDDFVIAKDGTRIAYHIRGEGKNTIFLFNGFTCSEPNVKLLVNILSQKYRIVFWDYKGHGQSETPRNFKEVTVAGSVDEAHARNRICNAGQVESCCIGRQDRAWRRRDAT